MRLKTQLSMIVGAGGMGVSKNVRAWRCTRCPDILRDLTVSAPAEGSFFSTLRQMISK